MCASKHTACMVYMSSSWEYRAVIEVPSGLAGCSVCAPSKELFQVISLCFAWGPGTPCVRVCVCVCVWIDKCMV